jgi:transcriptional regulator with XRE-family HTH domain
MKGKNITQKDLGSLMGVKAGTISYRIRNNAFKPHEIDFICKNFGINPEWVKIGIGDIYLENHPTYKSEEKTIDSDIQERSIEYYALLVGEELEEIISKEDSYSKRALIERIRDLEIKLLQAIDREKLAAKREREITDKYIELLEKNKG